MELRELNEEYSQKRDAIKRRLEEFKQLRDVNDYRLFKELAFVILTSRSEAKKSWDAVEKLDELGLLENGSREDIAEVLRNYDVQYEDSKAGYVVKNREKLSQPTLGDASTGLKLKKRIEPGDLEKTREQLVQDIEGIGWKGASHFLRNIGYGDGFAIVSAYISRKLYQSGLLESTEPPSSREEYLEVEQKFRQLSEETGIGTQELDLLLWSMETGEVFK